MRDCFGSTAIPGSRNDLKMGRSIRCGWNIFDQKKTQLDMVCFVRGKNPIASSDYKTATPSQFLKWYEKTIGHKSGWIKFNWVSLGQILCTNQLKIMFVDRYRRFTLNLSHVIYVKVHSCYSSQLRTLAGIPWLLPRWDLALGVVLFGEMSGRSKTHCFHDAQSPVSMHQKIRRDYPCEGRFFFHQPQLGWFILGKIQQGGVGPPKTHGGDVRIPCIFLWSVFGKGW